MANEKVHSRLLSEHFARERAVPEVCGALSQCQPPARYQCTECERLLQEARSEVEPKVLKRPGKGRMVCASHSHLHCLPNRTALDYMAAALHAVLHRLIRRAAHTMWTPHTAENAIRMHGYIAGHPAVLTSQTLKQTQTTHQLFSFSKHQLSRFSLICFLNFLN